MSKIRKKLENLKIMPVRGKYKPVSESEIALIEDKYKTELSRDFTEVVTEYGMSTFDGMITISIDDGYPLSVIFGGGKESYSIVGSIETYEDRLPGELMSFAEDEFGNLFCIGMGKETKGKIYYWYHDAETIFTNNNDGNSVLITDSFSKFVDCIEVEPFEDEE